MVVLRVVHGLLTENRRDDIQDCKVGERHVHEEGKHPHHSNGFQWRNHLLPADAARYRHEETEHGVCHGTEVLQAGRVIFCRHRVTIQDVAVHSLREEHSEHVHDEHQEQESPAEGLDRMEDGGDQGSECHDEAEDPQNSHSLDNARDADDSERFEARDPSQRRVLNSVLILDVERNIHSELPQRAQHHDRVQPHPHPVASPILSKSVCQDAKQKLDEEEADEDVSSHLHRQVRRFSIIVQQYLHLDADEHRISDHGQGKENVKSRMVHNPLRARGGVSLSVSAGDKSELGKPLSEVVRMSVCCTDVEVALRLRKRLEDRGREVGLFVRLQTIANAQLLGRPRKSSSLGDRAGGGGGWATLLFWGRERLGEVRVALLRTLYGLAESLILDSEPVKYLPMLVAHQLVKRLQPDLDVELRFCRRP
mmetsp:Transcript_3409/g.8090  ORF Transcript_3409/g.8090 Transcript_3409/m.8090 type:complete len:423 (+) Transcript_3409:668-1936(+)